MAESLLDQFRRMQGGAPAFTFGNAPVPVVPQQPAQTVQGLLGQANAIPDATPRNAAFRTPDLLALLGAGLLGDQGGDFLGGFLQGKQGVANQRTAMDQAQVERSRQGLREQAGLLQEQQARQFQQAQTDAKLRLDQDQFDRKLQQDQAQFDKSASIQQTKLKQDRELKEADDLRQSAQNRQNAMNNLLGKYDRAKSLGEMRSIVKNYNAIADDALKIDEPTLLRDYSERQRQWIDDAGKQFNTSLLRELNAFGEVSPAAAQRLSTERYSLAKAYGIDVKTLPGIPTGQTLRAQAVADRRKEFQQTFGQKQAQWQQGLAVRMANLDLAQKRFDYAQEHGNAMLGVAQGNLALRQLQTAQKDASSDQVKALAQIDKQLRGLNESIRTAPDDKVKARLKTQKDKLEGQRGFVAGLLPPDLQQQDFDANAPAMIGGKGGPQVYERKVNPVTQGRNVPLSIQGLGVNPVGQPSPLRGNIGGGVKLPSGWGVGRR